MEINDIVQKCVMMNISKNVIVLNYTLEYAGVAASNFKVKGVKSGAANVKMLRTMF
jgi:hypothetical protein